ncbi:hypothetical protein OQ483_24440 (plasmid) [Enterobacter bugandensis]|uniref:hypothetical protein n=1 Tax=Enterobacter bugandensis TaxID=881260 RepID=UPI00283AA221|nr:hypothetical protein [Enterobacter bugandensis]WMU75274.1 hypothetical protein OQ483_24440 [Enterobacter bugandensis]
MIPDYLTFIRFQDKRNLLFIYIVTLILLGFYGKNSGFSFTREDAWCVSGILALVLYAFIADLRAYWAYKCVVKNVDLSCFLGEERKKRLRFLFAPFTVLAGATLLFCGLTWGLFSLVPPDMALVAVAIVAPLLIWGIFSLLRPVYIRQVIVSARDTIKYRRLTGYLAVAVVMSVMMNLLTITPLGKSAEFDLYGRYFTLKTIITMQILCAVVLAINLLFLCSTKHYIFLGHLFLNEIDLNFSQSMPWRSLYAKPLWLRLAILLVIELAWQVLVGLVVTLVGGTLWFEAFFLLCYAPCLAYYTLHVWWKWHNDFISSCDMYLRWDEIIKTKRVMVNE